MTSVNMFSDWGGILVMKLNCGLGDTCIDHRHCLQPSLISFSLLAFRKKNYNYALANKLLNTACVSVNY